MDDKVVETNHQRCTPADEDIVPASCDGDSDPPQPLETEMDSASVDTRHEKDFAKTLLPGGDDGPPIPIQHQQQQDQLAFGDEEVEEHDSALSIVEEDSDRAPIPIQQQEQQLDDAKRKANAEISMGDGTSGIDERYSTTELIEAEEMEEDPRPIVSSRVGASFGEVGEEEVPSISAPRQRSRPRLCLADCDNEPPVPIQQQEQLLALDDAVKNEKKQEAKAGEQKSVMSFVEEGPDRAPIPVQQQMQQLDDAKEKAKAEISTANSTSGMGERDSTTELVAEETEEDKVDLGPAASRVGTSLEELEARVEISSMPTPRNDAADARLAPDEEIPIYDAIVVPTERTRLQTWVEHFRDNYKLTLGLTILVIASAITVGVVLDRRRKKSSVSRGPNFDPDDTTGIPDMDMVAMDADLQYDPDDTTGILGMDTGSEGSGQSPNDHSSSEIKYVPIEEELEMQEILKLEAEQNTLQPTTSTYRVKLLAPDGAAYDDFGKSVAIFRNTVVVGAHRDGDNGSASGSAHVFVRSGDKWTHQAKLLAPDGAGGDEFGVSVAIYGNSIVVGASWDGDIGSNSGSAHVFVRSGDKWTHQAKLLAPDGAGGDEFGVSVAIYGNSIVVGALWDGDNGDDSGSAHVFVRSGEEWTHQAKLLAPDGAGGDRFGWNVEIYGDTIVVGADGDDDKGDDSGTTHIFVRSGGMWTHKAKLIAPDGAAFDEFGESVAIYGDAIVVSAPWDDDNGFYSGSTYVFAGSGEEWTHQAKLLAPDGAASDLFGYSVAIYGDTIVVGAMWDDDNGSDSGSAHVFVRSGDEWTHKAQLLAPDGAAGDFFGRSAAIYGDTIVVGAYRDDDNGDNSGSAHVFVV